MLQENTIEKWKPIIDAYDRSRESVSQYCEQIGISARMFYYYRKQIYGSCQKVTEVVERERLLPVTVVDQISSTADFNNIKINGVSVSYQPDSISDQELSRILRLCRDL